ncbi:MAG: hypothetical protein GY841_18535 [FCB group bacterium]|nr:hypothetical protein [FCB group bacterium]
MLTEEQLKEKLILANATDKQIAAAKNNTQMVGLIKDRALRSVMFALPNDKVMFAEYASSNPDKPGWVRHEGDFKHPSFVWALDNDYVRPEITIPDLPERIMREIEDESGVLVESTDPLIAAVAKYAIRHWGIEGSTCRETWERHTRFFGSQSPRYIRLLIRGAALESPVFIECDIVVENGHYMLDPVQKDINGGRFILPCARLVDAVGFAGHFRFAGVQFKDQLPKDDWHTNINGTMDGTLPSVPVRARFQVIPD